MKSKFVFPFSFTDLYRLPTDLRSSGLWQDRSTIPKLQGPSRCHLRRVIYKETAQVCSSVGLSNHVLARLITSSSSLHLSNGAIGPKAVYVRNEIMSSGIRYLGSGTYVLPGLFLMYLVDCQL